VCVASVKPPSGAEYQPQLTDKRDGSVLVHCVPKEPGLHQLSVAYNDLPVKGSPWEFNAERVDLGQMRAYGAGLRHGVATAPCQFTVHSGSDNNTPGGDLAVCLSVCLSVYLSVCLSVCLLMYRQFWH